MPAPLAIGVDLGTQQLKVLAVDLERALVLGSVQAPIQNIKAVPGALEHDPHQWWPLLGKLTRELIERLQLAPSAIRSIGLSGHMHSIVPLKADGTPAFNCICGRTRGSDAGESHQRPGRRHAVESSIAAYSAKLMAEGEPSKPMPRRAMCCSPKTTCASK